MAEGFATCGGYKVSEQTKDNIARTWLLLGLLSVMVFVIESVVVHHSITTKVSGTSDFYSRWAGARAMLLEGRDPYSLEVTREIQAVIGVDPKFEGKGGFAYPLYIVFTFWPLVYLSYDWVQAIWMVTLQWVAIAAAVVLFRLAQWQPSPLGLVLMFLGTLFLYPVTRTIMLGQFTLHVTLFLALALWALQSDRDGWAGVCLAAATIKPQMLILVGPGLVLWALVQRRWRLIVGLLAGGLFLLLASMALFPRWPISFVEDVLRYSRVAGGRNPLTVLVDLVWPGGPDAIRYGLAGLLVLAMLAAWWRGRRTLGPPFYGALHWTIVVSLLVPFQTGTTNQVMLLIPLFAWLHAAVAKWGGRWPVAAVLGLEVVLWILFLTTIHGDWENPIMFLPLPLFCLVVLVAKEIRSWPTRHLPATPLGADRSP
jgi:hypothetical protein